MTNKILPVALVAALLGGTVGALVMRPSKSSQPETAQNAVVAGTSTTKAADGNLLASNELASDSRMTQAERDAFRDGFIEGIRTARDNSEVVNGRTVAAEAPVATATRATYRPAARRVARTSSPRRVYYDYGQQPRAKRSFWQKHRDKLTVAMGTGGGALVGGLIGGKKGALIGGLAGAGGSALYTYKLRKRTPRY